MASPLRCEEPPFHFHSTRLALLERLRRCLLARPAPSTYTCSLPACKSCVQKRAALLLDGLPVCLTSAADRQRQAGGGLYTTYCGVVGVATHAAHFSAVWASAAPPRGCGCVVTGVMPRQRACDSAVSRLCFLGQCWDNVVAGKLCWRRSLVAAGCN